MSLRDYDVPRDNFEPEDHMGMCFPCRDCLHRFMRDDQEPCRSCDHNANAVKDPPPKQPAP